MRLTSPLTAATLMVAAVACGTGPSASQRAPAPQAEGAQPAAERVAASPGERHLVDIRQLTHGGENGEAYFSADGRRLIFQSTRDGRSCDQQYVMNVDGSHVRRVSNGTGKTTCGYFYERDRRIFFASTHA